MIINKRNNQRIKFVFVLLHHRGDLEIKLLNIELLLYYGHQQRDW